MLMNMRITEPARKGRICIIQNGTDILKRIMRRYPENFDNENATIKD